MKFTLSSPFGALEEFREESHNGIDIAMPEGTQLRSIAEGVVERVVDYGAQNIGKGVIIKLQDGTRAIYGHMSEINVKVNEEVDAGELIGLSGNTGHSTGPHLHFGLWKDGEYLDPTPLIDTITKMSGTIEAGTDIAWWDIGGKIEHTLKEEAKEKTEVIIEGVLEALGAFVVDASYSIALIGGGVCIMLRVIGFKGSTKWLSLLIVAHVFIRYLLGG